MSVYNNDYSTQCKCPCATLMAACNTNDYDRFKRLVSERPATKQLRSMVMCYTIGGGRIEWIAHVHSINGFSPQFESDMAARSGDLNVLKAIYECSGIIGDNAMARAATHGNFECLVFAHENGAEWHDAPEFNAVPTIKDISQFQVAKCMNYRAEHSIGGVAVDTV